LVRLVLPKSELTVAESTVVVDERKNMPGRGAWLHRSVVCLRQAQRRQAFTRALRAKANNLTQVEQYLAMEAGNPPMDIR